MTKIAACIVTYRSPFEAVREAVKSLQRSTIAIDVTLVDNDSGQDYVRELKTLDNVRVIEAGANRGFGFGHNIGILNALPCDFYLVANPDVVVQDGCLEAMVDYLKAQPDIGLLAPKVTFPDGTLQPLNKRLPSVFDLFARRFLPASLQQLSWVKRRMDRYAMLDVGYESATEVPFISGCFMLFRKSVLDRVGGFDEGYFMYLEDCDITRRTAEYARCVYYPQATIIHHWARGSHRSLKLMGVMIRSMIYYFRHWGWKWL